jgi:hypothetical protein
MVSLEEIDERIALHKNQTGELEQAVYGFWEDLENQVSAFFESESHRLSKLAELKKDGSTFEQLNSEIRKKFNQTLSDVKIASSYWEDFTDLQFSGIKGYGSFKNMIGQAIEPTLISVADTPNTRKARKASGKLREIQVKQLDELVELYIPDNFNGVYFGPARTPSPFKFREKGSWTYVDEDDLRDDFDQFLETNPNSTFVQHNLARPLPRELPTKSYDLVFYNADFTHVGGFTRSAANLVKQNGLIITHPVEAEKLQALADFEVLNEYLFGGYTVLVKK